MIIEEVIVYRHRKPVSAPVPKPIRQLVTVLSFPWLWLWRCGLEKDSFTDFMIGWRVLYNL